MIESGDADTHEAIDAIEAIQVKVNEAEEMVKVYSEGDNNASTYQIGTKEK